MSEKTKSWANCSKLCKQNQRSGSVLGPEGEFQLWKESQGVLCRHFHHRLQRHAFHLTDVLSRHCDVSRLISHLFGGFKGIHVMIWIDFSFFPFLVFIFHQIQNFTRFSGPSAGESVSSTMFSNGSCSTSFCLMVGKHRKKPSWIINSRGDGFGRLEHLASISRVSSSWAASAR